MTRKQRHQLEEWVRFFEAQEGFTRIEAEHAARIEMGLSPGDVIIEPPLPDPREALNELGERWQSCNPPQVSPPQKT